MNENSLSPRLKDLVRQSVAVLGEVIRNELGEKAFRRIEKLRVRMTALRGVPDEKSFHILQKELKSLRLLPREERLAMAHAFTLMLELMNACENAYRSQIIRERGVRRPKDRPDAIFYVLTAHPTEARAPANIWVFHEILRTLSKILDRSETEFTALEQSVLRHLVELAWKTSLVRSRKPRVEDEAEHIYSTLLRDETLHTLLRASQELAPIFIRSWVGGDKDGHPGVNEKVFLHSLTLSRGKIISFILRRLKEVEETSLAVNIEESSRKDIRKLKSRLRSLQTVKTGDARRILSLRKELKELISRSTHPAFNEIQTLLRMFPSLVVPLEFRESSEVLMSSPTGKGLAIYRMLQALKRISSGGDPRWYVRGFIVSMASEIVHLKTAASMIRRALGEVRLPVIPLFEQAGALNGSSKVVKQMISDPELRRAREKYWDGHLEIMLGYSDSSKESGVLHSRLNVAETMHRLDHLAKRSHVLPIFFQGSGGSTDRGGGTVEEQTAWWSPSALRNYKVTVQGEMVERSLANPEITYGQIARINASAGKWKNRSEHRLIKSPVLDQFAERVARRYRDTVASNDFLSVVEHATPYRFLDLLRFGSRPTKRSRKVSVEGLRAIPWILCWTQTRILFPTWWGVGRTWHEASPIERRRLIRLGKKHALLSSYIRALGYTLVKVELAVWRTYLESSDLSREMKNSTWLEFATEYHRACQFARSMSGKRDLIAWRPWLEASIHLRSPMIHPLNLLQIIAMEKKDTELLRITVAGIASGMMTTG